MTKEKLVKEINESLQQFVGDPCNQATEDNIKSALAKQLRALSVKIGSISLPPIPEVSLNGNIVNVGLRHPTTKGLLTEAEFENWIKTGDL